jgi:peptidoglycan/xylan/chitin deacetylase (PgdA/CDA1 family)
MLHLISQVGYLTLDNVSLKKVLPPVGFSQGFVSLNFDDGWLSTFNNGLPILNAAGLRSTQYIVTGFLNKSADGYISTAQMLQMQAWGHEIGSHSKTHPQLPTLTEVQIRDEVIGSRNSLIGLTGGTISSFAYPYGEYNSLIVNIAKEAGYRGARTAIDADYGYNFQGTDPYLLKTQSVETTTTIDQAKGWINNAVQTGSWLTLVFHQVDNSGAQYSVTPAFLQQIVDFIKQNNVAVLTTGQGLQLISP